MLPCWKAKNLKKAMFVTAFVGLLLQLPLLTEASLCCDDIKLEIDNRTLGYNLLCSTHDKHLRNCCRVIEQDLRSHRLAYKTLCLSHEVDHCKSNPCHSDASCISNSGSFSCTCKTGFTGSGLNCTAKSCADLYNSGVRQDGVYTVNPDGLGPFQVRCDMTRDGGGWTIFQRRQDGSQDFYLGWQDYKAGFGDLNNEFWLGLDKIHRLSKSGNNVLRVDLTDFNSAERYAKYETFNVADASNKYRLSIGNYSGNAGNSLNHHKQAKFSTKDADNDNYAGYNCATRWKGGWWYHSCHTSNLNGLYLGAGRTDSTGVQWQGWKYDNLKITEMKIRPSQF